MRRKPHSLALPSPTIDDVRRLSPVRVDQTEFDEVYIENEDRRYELPSVGPQQDERRQRHGNRDGQRHLVDQGIG